MTTAAWAALLVGAVAAATDLAWRRIPNWLTLGGALIGLALAVLQGTVTDSLLGMGLALAIHLPLFALRLTSGGDVKLMAAIGAITGLRHWLTIFAFSAVLGGVVALAMVWRRRRLRQTAANVAAMLRGQSDLEQPAALTMPRGPVLALAVLLWCLSLR